MNHFSHYLCMCELWVWHIKLNISSTKSYLQTRYFFPLLLFQFFFVLCFLVFLLPNFSFSFYSLVLIPCSTTGRDLSFALNGRKNNAFWQDI